MISVEEALELVARNIEPLSPRRVPLGEAAGLVLAEDVVSEVNSPPYDKAMMDGYAVRSVDRQPERQIVEEIAAGDVPRIPLTPGTAARLMTGAPLPDGADAVVPLEQTEQIGKTTIRLRQVDPPAGLHVLRLGTALREGDTVLRSGSLLRPIEIAILAEIGRAMVTAIPRPRVAILPTGNELVAVGEKPSVGQIRNSNGPMLSSASRSAGAEATELGIARDDRGELRRWIEQGLASDVLLLSGGVSAGKFDLVPEVLAALGVEQVLHKIALRPGKPLWFGIHRAGERRVPVFGLPGNPVSSFVCFELFVRPTIAAMAGRGFRGLPSVRARLAADHDHPGVRAARLPARVTRAESGEQATGDRTDRNQLVTAHPADLRVEILPWHGSADLATLAAANGLACIPAEKQLISAGSLVEVLLI
jgi:molybdopterin molybdotransferase